MQGREKIGLVLTFTEMGFDVVVSDVDTVWLQDPLPYMAQYPEADILVSSDSLVFFLLQYQHVCYTYCHAHIPECLQAVARKLRALSNHSSQECRSELAHMF